MKGSELGKERKRWMEKGWSGTSEWEQRDHKDRKRSQVPSQPKDKSSSSLISLSHARSEPCQRRRFCSCTICVMAALTLMGCDKKKLKSPKISSLQEPWSLKFNSMFNKSHSQFTCCPILLLCFCIHAMHR